MTGRLYRSIGRVCAALLLFAMPTVPVGADTTSDLSVSGWALMALRSARLNGAPVPEASIREAIGFVLKSRLGAGKFRYLIWPKQFPSRSMSAVAVLCLELSGHHHHADGLRGGNYILERPLDFGSHRHYGAYYATQAMLQLGGTYWERFAMEFYPSVLGRQGEDGNWGTPYETAMTVLSLGVTCRQLPIYQR